MEGKLQTGLQKVEESSQSQAVLDLSRALSRSDEIGWGAAEVGMREYQTEIASQHRRESTDTGRNIGNGVIKSRWTEI